MKIKMMDISKKMEGHYIRLKSNVNGDVWKGKVKKITIMSDRRKILFDYGGEVTAWEAFNADLTYLD